MSEKVWIYHEQAKKWRCLKKDDPKLDWHFSFIPEGMVKFTFRNEIVYTYFGKTQIEVCEKYNQWRVREIAEYEKKIALLKEKLLRTELG